MAVDGSEDTWEECQWVLVGIGGSGGGGRMLDGCWWQLRACGSHLMAVDGLLGLFGPAIYKS